MLRDNIYESDVMVYVDGRTYTVPAGTQIRLAPGESIMIQQYLYHDFEVEKENGAVILGEVSLKLRRTRHHIDFSAMSIRRRRIKDDIKKYDVIALCELLYR